MWQYKLRLAASLTTSSAAPTVGAPQSKIEDKNRLDRSDIVFFMAFISFFSFSLSDLTASMRCAKNYPGNSNR